MTIQVDNALPPNVVEIGNEITQGVVDGLMSSSPSASSSNPYVTVNGVSGVYLPLAGGTMTGDIGVNYNDLNQVTSIVFADSTVQTTAPVNAATWGSITGTLSSQTDLQNALNTKLTASSNLSDLADAGTARTNLGVEYATNAEASRGVSTSLVINPNTLVNQLLLRKTVQLQGGLPTQSTGTGYGYAQILTYCNIGNGANTVGFTRGYTIMNLAYPNQNWSTSFNYPTYVGQGIYINYSATSYAGLSLLSRIGETNAPTAGTVLPDNPTNKRVGWKYVYGNNTIKLQVHDGTTYYETDTGYTPTTGFHYIVYGHNGAGTASITIYAPNGSVVTATRANAPTGGWESVISGSFVLQLASNSTTAASVNLTSSHPCFGISW